MTTRDQTNYAKGYQAALADITAAIENSYTGDAPEVNVSLALEAVERWISDNTPSDSVTYRGYWIVKKRNTLSGIPCFDIYANAGDMGKSSHLECTTNLAYAKKIIDQWKDAR